MQTDIVTCEVCGAQLEAPFLRRKRRCGEHVYPRFGSHRVQRSARGNRKESQIVALAS